jgi:hypothetical protein
MRFLWLLPNFRHLHPTALGFQLGSLMFGELHSFAITMLPTSLHPKPVENRREKAELSVPAMARARVGAGHVLKLNNATTIKNTPAHSADTHGRDTDQLSSGRASLP